MKVVHLLTSLNPGGIATFVQHLLPALSEEEIESEIVLTLAKGFVAQELLDLGYKIHYCYQQRQVDFRWSYRIGKMIRHSGKYTFGSRLTRLLRQINPDVLHSQMHGELWLAQLRAAHALNIPYALTLQSPSSTYPDTWQANQLFKRQLQRGDYVIGATPDVYDAHREFIGRIKKNVHAFGNGVRNGIQDPGVRNWDHARQIRNELNIPPEACVVGSVGRLISMKRYEDLLRAVATLDNSYHVLLVGEGSYRPNLEQLASDLGIADRTHFAGFVKDPAYWVNAIDIYVLPSLFEGQGIALVEAMAKGIPAIGTNVQGIRWVIDHEENGLLVEVKNVSEIAQAIERIRLDEAFGAFLGKNGREKFLREYEIGRIATHYAQLYRQMIEERGER